MNGLDLQNVFDFLMGFAIVSGYDGRAITVSLFIFFKKKQQILTGTGPLDTAINTITSRADARGSKKSLDDHTLGKKTTGGVQY